MDSHNHCRNGLQAGSAEARPGITMALASVLVLLSACSAVPDELNPVEWANEVDAYLRGTETESDPALAARIEEERALPVPGADQDFPKLSEVPGSPPTVTSYDERTEIAERLVRDRAETQYADAPAPIVTSTPVDGPMETPAMAALVSDAKMARVPTVSTPPLQTVTPRFT